MQEPNQVFYVGCLTGAADGDIAYTDDRDVERVRNQDVLVEEVVAQPHAHPVEGGKRFEPLVDTGRIHLFGNYGCLIYQYGMK